MKPNKKWQPVIGLEIHVQLNTKTKLFSPACNHFGDDPNQNISEICTGQPGALPLLNKKAVEKAILFGLAVGAKINPCSSFDRKSYFYPDSPRNFQITQFYQPIVLGGSVSAEVGDLTKEFAIEHAHLEDDAGMLKHFSNFAGVDYNRAGVPLIEIVSMPCMHSAKEAVAYAIAIKAILEYTGVSNCNMERGELRIDANISVRPHGEKILRPRTEIKNLNSFNFMEMALNAEIERQIDLYEKNPDRKPEELIETGTYRWNGKSISLMRKKEQADDYRYFPEPDLMPLQITPEQIDQIKQMLPELPRERLKRYLEEYELPLEPAQVLINHKKLADYFEKGMQSCKNPKALCNWIVIEFAGKLKDTGNTLLTLGVPAENVSSLVNLIENKTINGKIAKLVADKMLESPEKDPEEIVASNPDYQPLTDTKAIESHVLDVLKKHPQSIEDYKAGKTKALAFLVGQVMKLTRGKASPDIVNELIHKNITNL